MEGNDESLNSQHSHDSPPTSGQISPFIGKHKIEHLSNPSTMDKPCTCGKDSCPSCGSEGHKMSYRSYVYAIGKVVPRFPTRAIEIELAQASSRRPEEDSRGLTREEVIYKTLTDPANRYIAR